MRPAAAPATGTKDENAGQLTAPRRWLLRFRQSRRRDDPGLASRHRPPHVGVAVRPWNVGVDPAATEAALVGALSRLVAERGATISFLSIRLLGERT